MRLIAVDDDAPSAELIVRVAERCGFEAFATSDPRGVVALTQAIRPDAVAVDISMPHLDARGLFQLLAEAGYRGHLMIVSGQDQSTLDETARFAADLGLKRPFVHQKPLDFAKLRETLSALSQTP
jgi:DNA-binding response OmpR family regulator